MDESIFVKEKEIGKRYSKLLQTSIRQNIRAETTRRNGLMLKTTVKPTFIRRELSRLFIDSPRYSYMLHYGVETVRSNGRKISYEPTDHFSSIKEVSILNGLADEIGELRAEQVVSAINF